MLGIFQKGLAEAPKELISPAPLQGALKPKAPQETLSDFMSSHSNNAFSIGFASNALLAYAPHSTSSPSHRRLFCGVNDIYSIFMGGLNNICELNKQYGLSKCGNEAMFVIEAYRTLRDRGPYPAHQVLRDLEGSFGFVLYDSKDKTVFAALGGDDNVKLFWGIGADGSVVISEDLKLIKASCAKSFAPFPPGCMYHSERGLMSYEHPKKRMKAMPRVDSEGVMCGANFKVDKCSNSEMTINRMPRVGSEADWTTTSTWGPPQA